MREFFALTNYRLTWTIFMKRNMNNFPGMTDESTTANVYLNTRTIINIWIWFKRSISSVLKAKESHFFNIESFPSCLQIHFQLPSGLTVLNTVLTVNIKSSLPLIVCKHNISVNQRTHISMFLLVLVFILKSDDNQGEKVTYLRKFKFKIAISLYCVLLWCFISFI